MNKERQEIIPIDVLTQELEKAKIELLEQISKTIGSDTLRDEVLKTINSIVEKLGQNNRLSELRRVTDAVMHIKNNLENSERENSEESHKNGVNYDASGSMVRHELDGLVQILGI